jgi:hypothetical protein
METRSESLPPTSTDLPSGIHVARAMPRSIACVRFFDPWPGIKTDALLPAIVRTASLVGENCGNWPATFGSGFISPVATFTAWTPPPPCPPPARANTTDAPSFVHVMAEAGGPGGRLIGSVHVPEVSRFIAPPAAGTTQTCVGVSASVIV